jgi:predicted ATPase
MSFPAELSRVLQCLMQRSGYAYTPGLLSKLSGVPKTTIVHWLEGRVSRPRHWQDLARVADALRLSEHETNELLRSAGHAAIHELRTRHSAPQDQALLAGWPPVLARTMPQAGSIRPGNIPFLNQALIGREAELAAAQTLLRAPGARLLVVAGCGGVGKSLLMAHAAHALQACFRDGVVWVALDAIGEAAQLLPALAHALGASEPSDSVSLPALLAALGGRQLLVILDTFEHLVAATPLLDALFGASAQLTIVVTSRSSLPLPSASTLTVEPLSVPDARITADLTQIAACPAVRLFVQRARLVCPSFALTPANAAEVAAICIELDGLPLALELAAARLKIMSPRELLGHLQDSAKGSRLQLLAAGKRDAPARQQTLGDSIAWSYRQLPPAARSLLQHLVACEPGTSLVAALELSARHDGPALASEALLANALPLLIEQRFVRLLGLDGEQPRLSVSAIVREYVRMQPETRDDGLAPALQAREYEA